MLLRVTVVGIICLFSLFDYCMAENISKVIIRIEIDQTKQSGYNWDTINIFGREPDPYGTIEIHANNRIFKKEIDLKNTFTIEEVFNNVDLSPGDEITIDLEDYDRGRWNDTICKGSIRWDGEPKMEVRHGYATIKMDFII